MAEETELPGSLYTVSGQAATTPAGVWPPPPTAAPVIIVPFKTLQKRSIGYSPLNKKAENGLFIFPPLKGGFITDFRVGEMSIHPEGIAINGKAVTPLRKHFWILTGLFWVRLWLLAAIVMEYGIRNPRTVALRWDDIYEVVFIPKASAVCIVYREMDKNGKPTRYSLATKLRPAEYEQFQEAIEKEAPGSVMRVPNGKIMGTNASAFGYSFVLNFCVVLVILGLLYVYGMHVH